LREARFGGLVTHLFALRAFLPDAIGDARCAGLSASRDLLREELDRLFIKLRLPNYVIAARDVETPSLRSALEHLAREAGAAHGVPTEPPGGTFTLWGSYEPSELQRLGERFTVAPLATALPWAALARLLPDDAPVWASYRRLLIDSLQRFDESESQEFIDALQRSRDPALDDALDEILSSLHSLA
jgi:hypothetical protein